MTRLTSESSYTDVLFFRSFCLWRWFAEPPSRCLHIAAAIATESPSLKSSALFCPHSLRLYAGRLIGRGVCPCCCLFSSGMVTSPFTSQSSVTRTFRQGPLTLSNLPCQCPTGVTYDQLRKKDVSPLNRRTVCIPPNHIWPNVKTDLWSKEKGSLAGMLCLWSLYLSKVYLFY